MINETYSVYIPCCQCHHEHLEAIRIVLMYEAHIQDRLGVAGGPFAASLLYATLVPAHFPDRSPWLAYNSFHFSHGPVLAIS
eukprot:1722851-Pleurochrysis_carterae.AAC.1